MSIADPSAPSPIKPPAHANQARWCMLGAITLLILIAWPIILSGNSSGRGAWDDLVYHWPTIQTFADQLPTPDFSDYKSATTPAYHLELAVLHRLGLPRIPIQLYASLWTVLLIALLAWRAGRAYSKPGLILTLPLLTSIYLLFPAIWLLPDNAGWLAVLILLILALEHPPTPRIILTSGIVLALLVLLRQVHIWAAAIIWTSAWIGTDDQTPSLRTLFSTPTDRARRLALALLAAVPAALLLLYFLKLWGGLVPPTFQSQHQGPNPATPAFILTQIAILSAFFAPLLLPQLRRIITERRATTIRWISAALVLGILLAVIPESTFNRDAGRFSGYWNIINALPTFANRSPIILLGAPAGAVACVLWSTMISRRDTWILSIALLAFAAAQATNHASWQRYHEPMLLITGLLILTRSPIARSTPKRTLLGALGIAALFTAITIPALLKATPVEVPSATQPSEQIPKPTP